jgi:hypothetical protein
MRRDYAGTFSFWLEAWINTLMQPDTNPRSSEDDAGLQQQSLANRRAGAVGADVTASTSEGKGGRERVSRRQSAVRSTL